MRIRTHSESHVVELDDGSQWKIFPGDLDVTLNWKPETDLSLERIADDVSSHALVSSADKSRVRVIPAAESWPITDVKTMLRDG
jgi:hypothetical protein